ncbi:hypothetical protein C8Q79DRAFT_1011385 [Trametes meyenii]|nr:hypothetical protein C8Q79DRAFT_1011385 [Trametes meyenii]
MAIPAKCMNCANDPSSQQQPYQPNTNQPYANLGVVLGVLGGCSLVALVVATVVPVIRRRVHRQDLIGSLSGRPRRSSYRKVNDRDVERGQPSDATAGGTYLPSRRPSFRHQKMFAGPDAQPLLPLLLDPLRPISALTWSDFRSATRPRSLSPSARSRASASAGSSTASLAMPDDDPAATDDKASFVTNHATTSHRTSSSSSSRRSARDRAHDRPYGRDELGRPVISDDGHAPATRAALPPPHRSPTPPGLASKREYAITAARRASLPLPITPTSPADSGPRAMSGTPMFAPHPSLSSSALMRHPSGRPRTATQKPGMEPVLEDSAADVYAETRSLQLPSPPASPEQPQLHWRGVITTTTSSSSSHRRPSLTSTSSAPTATTTPYRPRSSTGPAIPLTAAFRTSVLRSGTQSTTASSLSGQSSRYPSIITSSPHLHRDMSTRVRPSSVSVTQSSTGLLSPESPDMTRPTEAFRRMSTTDIRHRRPSGASPDPGSDDPRAYLRTSDAARTPQVLPNTSHYEPRAATLSTSSGAGPSFITPPPNPLSLPALASTPPRLSVHTRPPGVGPSSVTWHASPAGSTTSLSTQQQQQVHYQHQSQNYAPQQHGPALVRKKDSTALRPIPVSALMHSPSNGHRSRSNSVRSTRMVGAGAGPAQLPPLDPVTPLTMSSRASPEDEEVQEERR